MTKLSVAPQRLSRVERIIAFIGTTKFFLLILGLFVFETLWIALTARYPQAFDEQLHFGMITIYSHHLSPFLTSQPASANQYGAIVHDPSYLYQYLLSFPLRLIRLFTDSITVQVIVLRLLNIAFFVSGLVIFRQLFRLTKVSSALTHCALLCFVLLPVVPLLASQINYDNLAIPLVALTVYWTARFSTQLHAGGAWSWLRVAGIMGVCLFASLVKYPFLPIFVAIVLWLFAEWRWHLRHREKPVQYVKTTAFWLRWTAVGVLLLIGLVLFSQRYGFNLVKYHTPIPECDQVLSVQACQAYGPWARNYQFDQQGVHPTAAQIATYPFIWVYHSLDELVFTISSSFYPDGTINYQTGIQLIIPEITVWAVFGLGLLAVIWRAKVLLQNHLIRLYLLVALLYIAALGGQNYLDYLHLGYPVAIHGRYLLPVLPLLLIPVALAFRDAVSTFRLPIAVPARKLLISASISLVLLVEGGGFVTYIVRSNPSWFWPQSSPSQTLNWKTQSVLKKIALDTGS